MLMTAHFYSQPVSAWMANVLDHSWDPGNSRCSRLSIFFVDSNRCSSSHCTNVTRQGDKKQAEIHFISRSTVATVSEGFRRMKLFLLISFCVTIAASAKVSERWTRISPDAARCKIVLPNGMDISSTIQMIEKLMPRYILQMYHRMNCSVTMIPFSGRGTPNATGHYDGLVGMLQRNQFDITPVGVRIDALAFQPIKHSATMIDAEFCIVTGHRESTFIQRELISFISAFPFVFYVHFSTVIFIVTLLLSYISFAIVSEFDIIRFTLYVMHITFDCWAYLLRQNVRYPSQSSSRVVFAAFAIYVTCVTGYWLNEVGSNLKANRPVAQIDSLENLLETSEMKITYMQVFSLTEVMQSSPVNTNMNRLWNRVKNNLDQAVIDKTPLSRQQTVKLFLMAMDDLKNGERAIIMPRKFVKFQRMISCILGMNKEMTPIHTSEEFGQGIATCMFSHKIHPFVEKFVNYILITLFEAGFKESMNVNFPNLFSQVQSIDLLGKHFRCIEGRPGEEDTPAYQPFDLHVMGSLFYILFATYGAIFGVLMLEILFGRRPRRSEAVKKVRFASASRWE